MKLSYFSMLALGVSISLTSCISTEPEKVTETRQIKKTMDFNQLKGSVVNFDQIVSSFDSPDEAFRAVLDNNYVVVDFSAETWCEPCRQMAPNFDAAASEFTNILFVKINIDKYRTIMRRFNIKSIPTLIYLKNGSVVRRTGFLSRRALSKEVSRTLR